jgi:pimeloyl-ACP methyl ester carboxylesterase
LAIVITGTAVAGEPSERTTEEIKAVMLSRAERGMYPMIGIDVADAREALSAVHTRNPDEWAAAWSAVAARYVARAEQRAASDPAKANEDYIKAWRLYSLGRWPVPSSPGKQRAYAKALEVFLDHARYLTPPLEVVHIPFEGSEIIGYLGLPKRVGRPVPLVIAINGLDSRKEDLAERFGGLLPYGVGFLAVDAPGTGQAPIKASPTADRMFLPVLDHLSNRPEVDKTRIAVYGGSLGAYWAEKLAIIARARLAAVVAQSPAVDAFWTERFLMHSVIGNTEYPFDFAPALMTIFDGVKTLEQLAAIFPTMSLANQHLLDKPTTPMLIIAGTKDTQVPIVDAELLLETGDGPKEAWINPRGGHMGREDKTWNDPVIFNKVVVPWLLRALGADHSQECY